MRTTRLLTLGTASLLALAALPALAGCGSEDAGGQGAGTGTLAGRTFLSTGVTVDGAPRPLVQGSRIRLTFTDDGVSAQPGCNTIGGSPARVTDGRLVVEVLGGTEMACEPALMDQDTWFADLLTAEPAVALDGMTLTLTSGGTVVTLLDREEADPDRPLVGTAWTLDGLVSGETASSVPAGVTATLRFTAAGQMELSTGCNRGAGSAVVTPDSVTISDLGVTLVGCTGPQAEVESAVLSVLGDGVTQYTIEAGALTLTRGSAGLTYRAG